MPKNFSINFWLSGLTSFLLIASSLVLGLAIYSSFGRVRTQYIDNLKFRSDIFRNSIDASMVMGDYVSVLKRSKDFFQQNDVMQINIALYDGTQLVSFERPISPETSNEEKHSTVGAISILDNVEKVETVVARVNISYDLSSLNVILRDLIWKFIFIGLLFFFILLASLFYFSSILNGPLRRLANKLNIGRLEVLSTIQPGSRISELLMLESSIVTMSTQLISLKEKEIESAKSAAVGRVSAQLTHDMRAPIGIFERLLSTADEDLPQMKGAIAESVKRLYTMVEAIRYGEIESIVKRSENVIDFSFCYQSLLAKSTEFGIKIIVPEQAISNAYVDLPKLERSWINLVSNALEFAGEFVRVEARVEGSDIIIQVIDDGPGVPDEFLPKLFQRGATHGKHDGTGLGLAYVKQVMQGHGGDVTYRREGGLTIFECHLPNAVETESEEVVEKSAVLDLQLVQKLVRAVAICLEPEQLSKSVVAKLASFNSDEFLFSEEREGANIVVSNIDEIMFEVLEGDEQEFIHVTRNWGGEEAIVAKLQLKFNLD